MLFPHYPSLGCEHPADGRMRGLSSSSAQVVQRKTEVQTPHPSCGNENFCLPGTHHFCLPGTHHRVVLEISPEGPASFGVFHNKGLASWIQTKLSLEVSLAEILPTDLENLPFCPDLSVFQTPLCLEQLRTVYWRKREAVRQLSAARRPGRLQRGHFSKRRHFGCSGSPPGSCKWG